MRTVRTAEEREHQREQLACLMLANRDYRNDCWKCIRAFYREYHGLSLDEVIDTQVTSISTMEREWRKLREKNPKLKDKELSQDEYKQIALDNPVIEKDGTITNL